MQPENRAGNVERTAPPRAAESKQVEERPAGSPVAPVKTGARSSLAGTEQRQFPVPTDRGGPGCPDRQK